MPLACINYFCSLDKDLGSHPCNAHVPPKGNESITATLHPAELHFSAVVDAAVPDPIR
jgi:hypothetical protein